MAIIPAEEKVFMVSNSTNTTYSGSAALKAMQQWYTMEDVTNTVRPYQVFTALLTQSGGDGPQTVYVGTNYGPNPLTIGITYTIVGNDTTDFTNVGAPNNEVGTSFLATGTNPNNQNTNDQTYLAYNTGAPVATVLENTIGNVWFVFNSDGRYSLVSDGLFVDNKTAKFGGYADLDLGSYFRFGSGGDVNAEIFLYTGDPTAANAYLVNATIEVRVYN